MKQIYACLAGALFSLAFGNDIAGPFLALVAALMIYFYHNG